VNESRWLFLTTRPQDVVALAAALQLTGPAARVLLHRGLNDPAAARRFLEPSLDHLHDPFSMRGMAAAIDRLARAIRDREPVLIYGDYDVDGTTSVVLLIKAIELGGGAASYHVPHRLKDGYGMRPEVVEAAAAQGVKLIVSVDTGIRAAQVVRRANELGIDVIVTDHHLPETDFRAGGANPNQPDCPYPKKNLCGAEWRSAIQALLPALAGRRTRCVALPIFLKLVAIATVADVVPPHSAKTALSWRSRFARAEHGEPGLRAARSGGLHRPSAPNARQVAFQIALRMNAALPHDTARDVVELFTTDLRADLARQLPTRTPSASSEAQIRDICRAHDGANPNAPWPITPRTGTAACSIVASRLVERLQRPAPPAATRTMAAQGPAAASRRSTCWKLGIHARSSFDSAATSTRPV
jgi:single-stranded-DNA-specific exonuclease